MAIQCVLKFTIEQATKDQRGKKFSSILSLTSVLDGENGHHHTPAVLPSGKRPSTHGIGGWLGPRAGLDGRG